MEQWKIIKDYPNYSVSNYGRVRNDLTCKILKQNLNSSGYYRVSLKRKHLFVHRLVAIAFIDNPNNYPVVNHLDEDKTNNSVSNLEWCTQSHNVLYGDGRTKQLNSRKDTKHVIVDGTKYISYNSAFRGTGIPVGILRTRTSEYKGHKIKYLN